MEALPLVASWPPAPDDTVAAASLVDLFGKKSSMQEVVVVEAGEEDGGEMEAGDGSR